MNGSCKCLNRVRPSEIRPTVTARPSHSHTESPASQRLMRDALQPGSIDRHELSFAANPWRIFEQVSNTAKISLPFFTYISNSNDRTPKLDARRFGGPESPQQCHDAGAVVRDSRKKERAASSLQPKLGG